MANMSTAMQMATQPRPGGLGAMQPPPQGQPPQGGPPGGGMPPNVQAQQNTGAALMADQFEQDVALKAEAANYGDMEFAQRLKSILKGGLPSRQELERANPALAFMPQQAPQQPPQQMPPQGPQGGMPQGRPPMPPPGMMPQGGPLQMAMGRPQGMPVRMAHGGRVHMNEGGVTPPPPAMSDEQLFAKKLRDLLETGALPDIETLRGFKSGREEALRNLQGQLQQKPVSGIDAVMAGLATPLDPRLLQKGMMGSALAAMSNAGRADLKNQEAENLKRAMTLENELGGYMDKTIGQVEKGIGLQQKLNSMSNGVITRQQKDGTIHIIDKTTGNPIRIIPASESEQFRSFFDHWLKIGAEKGEYSDMDQLSSFAAKKASEALALSRQAAGGNKTPPPAKIETPPPAKVETPPPATSDSTTPPPASTDALRESLDLDTTATRINSGTVAPDSKSPAEILGTELGRQLAANKRSANLREQEGIIANLNSIRKEIKMLPKAQQEQAERWANQAEAAIAKKTPVGDALAEKRVTQVQQMLPPPEAPTQAPMAKVDPQKLKEKEGYGTRMGQHMADTSVDIQKTGAAANSLIGDLNVLESLYKQHGDNVPEGQLAPVIANIKSAGKSLGIDVQGTGPTDVINALAVKQALQSRTASGENLLPGAMSNYEDQLLQKSAPTLALTQEGRLTLIQIMKAQLEMKAKLATAAREYVSKNKRLDEGWFNVAEEIAKTNPFLDPKRIEALNEYGRRLSQGKK